MIAIALSIILTAQVSTVCDVDDAVCLRRELLRKADEVDHLKVELVHKDRLLEITNQENNINSSNLAALRKDALNISKLGPRWYESPQLWLGIGVFAGIGLTVLSGWAIGQAATH